MDAPAPVGVNGETEQPDKLLEQMKKEEIKSVVQGNSRVVV
jgi:hypothetical protein